MSGGTETDTDVLPCRVCASPVFDDELYCESCGAVWPASRLLRRRPRRPADRQDHDLGVIAAVTDRGHHRPRNEDAVAIAAVNDRFVAVVCDGVASTANSDQAARAAADAVLTVLEPSLHLAQWPATAALQQRMNEAFVEAQEAVMLVPDDEPDGQAPGSLDDDGRRPGIRRACGGRQHRRQPGLLVELGCQQRQQQQRDHGRRFVGAGPDRRRGGSRSGVRRSGSPHDHTLDRGRCGIGGAGFLRVRGDRARPAGAVHRRALELLRGRRAAG